jgi:hypothetical protein
MGGDWLKQAGKEEEKEFQFRSTSRRAGMTCKCMQWRRV